MRCALLFTVLAVLSQQAFAAPTLVDSAIMEREVLVSRQDPKDWRRQDPPDWRRQNPPDWKRQDPKDWKRQNPKDW
jgi:hypothetical protein